MGLINVQGFQSFRVSEFQGFRVSGFQDFRVSEPVANNINKLKRYILPWTAYNGSKLKLLFLLVF
jgi:hypothetical protein